MEHLKNALRFSPLHAVLAVVAYVALAQAVRFSRLQRLERTYRDRWLTTEDGKRRLDVTPAEAQEIMHLSFKRDLPGIVCYGTVFALFKTYAIPSISEILVKSGQFSSAAHVARRYTDTKVLVDSYVSCPVIDLASMAFLPTDDKEKDVDPRSAIAVARVNWLHSRWPMIRQEDYLYTLALFILEPIRWAKRYGWRPLAPLEEEVGVASLQTSTKPQTSYLGVLCLLVGDRSPDEHQRHSWDIG